MPLAIKTTTRDNIFRTIKYTFFSLSFAISYLRISYADNSVAFFSKKREQLSKKIIIAPNSLAGEVISKMLIINKLEG